MGSRPRAGGTATVPPALPDAHDITPLGHPSREPTGQIRNAVRAGHPQQLRQLAVAAVCAGPPGTRTRLSPRADSRDGSIRPAGDLIPATDHPQTGPSPAVPPATAPRVAAPAGGWPRTAARTRSTNVTGSPAPIPETRPSRGFGRFGQSRGHIPPVGLRRGPAAQFPPPRPSNSSYATHSRRRPQWA